MTPSASAAGSPLDAATRSAGLAATPIAKSIRRGTALWVEMVIVAPIDATMIAPMANHWRGQIFAKEQQPDNAPNAAQALSVPNVFPRHLVIRAIPASRAMGCRNRDAPIRERSKTAGTNFAPLCDADGHTRIAAIATAAANDLHRDPCRLLSEEI